MIYYIDDKSDFEELKKSRKHSVLLAEKVSETNVILTADNIKGEIDLSLFKKMVYDLIKYYDTIVLNWHMTLPSFELCRYPKEGNTPKTIIRYGGKIVGINPFVQDLVGDIIRAISENLKHRNKKSDIVTVDFIENSIDNKG
ncbi:MAG: hypothetical protein GWP03_06565 [Proteobacteria bacterium]|nr:hypothetical protein [Pseudomonadota bacterium]